MGKADAYFIRRVKRVDFIGISRKSGVHKESCGKDVAPVEALGE